MRTDLAKLLDELKVGGASWNYLGLGEPELQTLLDGLSNQQGGRQIHAGLVWLKDRLVLGQGDYHYRHEPVLYGYKGGYTGRRGRNGQGWYGGHDQTSVFEFATARRNEDHPTAKPVGLVEAMLRNSRAG